MRPLAAAATRKQQVSGAILLLVLAALGAPFALGAQEPGGLLEAAKEADWATVRSHLEAGADPNATAADGATALHWAAYHDHGETAGRLLDAGADPNATNDLDATPLWNAGVNGSAAMVGRLLDAGADPNAALLGGESVLMTAARTGNPDVVRMLLDAGADPNATGARGQTALMWAAAQKHPDTVRLLVERGADVDARSESWSQLMAIPPHSEPANQQMVPHGANTALLFAARVGDLESARILVAAGSDLDATDAWGVTPTVYAAHSGFRELAEFFVGNGADPNIADAGFSALHLAILRRDGELVRILLDHGADPNTRLRNWTPTRRASRDWYIHPALVGAAPLWLAARFSEPGIMRLLADAGADPHFVHRAEYIAGAGTFGAASTVEETTTLMAAVGMGGSRRMRAFLPMPDPLELEGRALEAVRIAVELGVDIHAVDLEGRTATERAGFPSIRSFLEAASAGQQ